jgi:hypothetical protein
MAEDQVGGEWWQSSFDDDWLALALALDKPEETELRSPRSGTGSG